MKKRIIKMTSLLLAASITLTSCSGSFNPLDPFGFFSSKDDEKGDKKEETTKKEEGGGLLDGFFGLFGGNTQTGLRESTVSKEDLTSVTNEAYNYYGSEGKYTGEWYDGHPEGEGRFFVSDDEYCDGEWVDGLPFGNVELRVPRSGEAYMYYKGVYADNKPCGDGYMEYGYSDDQGWGYVEGDFSDKKSLYWYSFDENGFPVDMGMYSANGERVSYTDESKFEGVLVEKPQGIKVWFLYDTGYQKDNVLFQYYSGKYYGPTDEEGRPNGWGYYHASPLWRNRYVAPDGRFYLEDYYDGQFGDNYKVESLEEEYKEDKDIVHLVNIRHFGYWEHGKPVKQQNLTYYLSDTNEMVGQLFYNLDDEGEYYGDYIETLFADSFVKSFVSYELTGMAKSRCSVIVKKYNMDKSAYDLRNYRMGSDGYYRSGDYETVEYYEDGTIGYFRYYYVITDTEEYERLIKSKEDFWIDPTGVGVYYIYDQNDNVIEQGQKYRGLWRDDSFIENNERVEAERARYEKLCIGLYVGGLAIGIGLAIHSGKVFEKRLEEYNKARAAHDENEFKHDELVRQAESAANSGNYYEAERLYKEASDIPIIAVPSIF